MRSVNPFRRDVAPDCFDDDTTHGLNLVVPAGLSGDPAGSPAS
jgi:hypothetical protein